MIHGIHLMFLITDNLSKSKFAFIIHGYSKGINSKITVQSKNVYFIHNS